MKIIITESSHFGGTDTYTLNLYRYWINQNEECKIIINNNPYLVKQYKKYVDYKNLIIIDHKIKYLNFLKIFKNIFILLHNILAIKALLCKKKSYDFIIVSGGWPGGLLIISSLFLTPLHEVRTLLFSLHNSQLKSKLSYISREITILLMKKYDKIKFYTVSNYTKNELEIFFKNKIRFKLIHNCIEDFQKINLFKTFDINNIVFVGHIEKRKGLSILFHAINSLNLKYDKNYKLYVYGNIVDENYFKELKSIQGKLEVKWCGFESNKNKIYHNKSLLVLPSIIFESFGLVIIEAMCSSIPALVTEDMGTKEVIVNSDLDTDKFCFKKGDSRDLSEKIYNILNSSNYEDMRIKSRNSYLKYFELSIMMRKIQNLL